MEKPNVTVVITVYGRTQFLQQALRSALDQKYHSYEIIVTDDSCDDTIREIVGSFKNPLISYRCNSPTLGIALSLRAAIGEARGDYIAILNDDDVWEPEFLSTLVKPLEHDTDCVLSFCDHWIISEDGELETEKTHENTSLYGRSSLPEGKVENITDLVLRKNGVPLAMASLFRKDAIDWKLLTQDVSGAYDYWISCLLAASGKSIYYVPIRLTRYRVHGGMETARRAPDKNVNLIYIYTKLMEMPFFKSEKSLLTQKYSQALFHTAKDNLYFNHRQMATSYFLQSLKAKITIKACIGLGLSYLPRKALAVLRFSKP